MEQINKRKRIIQGNRDKIYISFPLIERKVNTKYFSFKSKFSLENEDKIKIHKISYNNKKTSFENDLNKNKKTEKIKEVKKGHIK